MTDNNRPITPPEEVIDKWESEWHHHQGKDTYEVFMAKQAARWGADQELEACCEWLSVPCPSYGRELRNARRPKTPSLKEQALVALHAVATGANDMREQRQDFETIRLALEQLDG